MPAYRFTGACSVFYVNSLPTATGSGYVNPGDVFEFEIPPSPSCWVPVEESPETPQEPAAGDTAPVTGDATENPAGAVSGPSGAISGDQEDSGPDTEDPYDPPSQFRH